MKKSAQILCAATSLLLLTGCYINKYGNICSITMPRVYCDDEVYKKLTNPGRMVDRWNLNGRTSQARLQDWMDCGGDPQGDYALAPLTNGEERTHLQENAEGRIKAYSIYRCMMKKNYEHTGQCTSSVMSDSPPCRARAGLPWE